MNIAKCKQTVKNKLAEQQKTQNSLAPGAGCLVLHNDQQTSSWSITLMVVVGHGMRTGAHLAN